ncbi:MAG: hypothetical protein IPO81_15730 [Kouleothrix sp.]|nr:hypothetical protein [Kouleothrix sp.]
MRRRFLILVALAALLAMLVPMAVSANSPVNGAAFTTVNESVDGTGHCKNGNPNTNCNIYDGKEFVWMNGGPSTAYVGDGTYFFAVLDPGGQADPNDGAAKNLSDDYDTYTNRTFSVSGGTVTYGGSHDFANNKIRLMPYADTTNPGGVYILAICSLADGYPANASDCKYDAFKVQEGEVVNGEPLTISKNADGAYDNTYTWTIAKSVDKTYVTQASGNVTFTYTVSVGHDAGTSSNVTVSGTITVFNPNDAPVVGDVSDILSDGTVCSVTGGSTATFQKGDNEFAYSCDLSGLPQGQLDNTASVSWSEQLLNNGALLAAGSANFTFSDISFTENAIDECVSVSDSYAGALGTVCVGDDNPTSFTYTRTVPVVANACVDYDNTATFTTNDTGATGSASQTVTVCGPVKGGLTMGFWQNPNGQNIIKSSPTTSTLVGTKTIAVCNVGTWLRTTYAPFADLKSNATCAEVATYVTNVIKAANASGAAMNAMLKGQMLATALDVYFSDTTIFGSNPPIKAYNGGYTNLGSVKVDLTKVCKNIAGGCTIYENTSSAFGGATSLTVSQLLSYAASQSNAGGSAWYGQVKATQELAKDTFDAINNQVAFVAP